jgi:hypothetical protein
MESLATSSHRSAPEDLRAAAAATWASVPEEATPAQTELQAGTQLAIAATAIPAVEEARASGRHSEVGPVKPSEAVRQALMAN